jgi:transcriptional regulator with GAF, ATPase, and Fis domain
LIRALGQGATSAVFQAEDLHSGASRAVKLLHLDADEAQLRAEFSRLSRWSHPHLVQVHDLGRITRSVRVAGRDLEEGLLYLVMDRVDGVGPAAALARTAPEHREDLVLGLAGDVAAALLHLHSHGLVHHDVKPTNVLLRSDGRAVLLDLGLATRSRPAGVRGTPAYLAPEALVEGGDHRVDLYALGATLFEVIEEHPPFAGGGAELIRRILEEEPELHAPWPSEGLRELVLSLLRKDPGRRPASARTVLAELARLQGDHRALAELSSRDELLTPPLVGRDRLLDQVGSALRAAGAHDALRLLLLAGDPGMGKTRLLHEALRRHRIQAATGGCAPVRVLQGDLRQVVLAAAALFGSAPSAVAEWARSGHSSTTGEDLALQMGELLEDLARESSEKLVIHLLDLDADPLTQGVLRARAASDAPVPLLVIGETTLEARSLVDLTGSQGALVLEVGRLSAADVEALVGGMLGRPADPAISDRVAQLSKGNPTLVVELVRQWREHGEAGLDLERVESLDPLVQRSRAFMSGLERRVMDGLAVWNEPATPAEIASLLGESGPSEELWPVLEELARRGAVVLEGDRARLPSPAHVRAWRGTWGTDSKDLHRRAAVLLLRQEGADPSRLAEHLWAAGEPGALEAALRAGRALAAAHAPLRAIPFLEHVARSEEKRLAEEAIPLLAELYLQTGRYDEVLSLLQGAAGALALVRAQALQRRGDYREAEAALRSAIPELETEDQRCQAAALLGRLMLQQGRSDEARQVTDAEAEHLLALGGGPLAPGGAALLEVAGLARYYQGRLVEADRLFERGEEAMQEADPPERSRLARFVNLRGMVASGRGELEGAARLYQRALELVLRGGDPHGRATYLCNVGSMLLDTGRLGESLDRITAAIRDLERLGRTTELAQARCNLANLLLLLGDLDHADRELHRAGELLLRAGSQHTEGFLLMLQADLLRRRGQPEPAAEKYREAGERLAAAGADRERALAEIYRADALREAGELSAARDLLSPMQPSDPELAGGLALSWIRLHLASAGQIPAPPGTVRRLAEHCAWLDGRGAAKELWRAAAVLGRQLRAEGRRGAAREALQRAHDAWEVMVKHAPEVYHERMRGDADAQALATDWDALLEHDPIEPELPVTSTEPLAGEGHRLRRLLAINKRLNSELRLPRLLELIMDTVVELTEAERGFLLLAEDDGSLSIKVARNIDRRSLAGEELALSLSIAEDAARTGAPVVTVDAAADGRFREALSVSDLHLRSVLAVPLVLKGRTVGTVYVDNRLRRGVFGDEEVGLVQDVADQAAIAIENARLLAENRRRQREIELLNRQLRQKVERQQAELIEVREELRTSKETLWPQQEYQGIIGRSARMKDLFHLLGRVTETQLPVVIQGESGTGKELVARAIHDKGPRSARPFVSENCAAIPETLLESVLFGHVRGAFTGADRDRKGLFEVASGGTLFLDEVGEMSPAMQTKLLRVLQNGELRRVGGSQTLRTDVRVIAASNKDLAQMVADGRFREDLYYRLNVVQIQIPPLRDRREDIPLLVDHFLAKHDSSEGRRISPEAMAQLIGYAWPGNVRELENEIMRATALGGRLILPRDLSPNIGGSVPLALSGTNDLCLRTRVEHLERELLDRALKQTAGNQTQAARLLGLSRFGLLKKLRRYEAAAGIDRTKTSESHGAPRKTRGRQHG